MSVIDVRDKRGGDAPAPRGSGSSDFERTAPQDMGAEQCVLGGMLLSKDAIADVVELIRPGDFYRPAHQTIYEAILDLYGRGEPADPTLVADELLKRGEIARVGGIPYLHTLVSSVPTAANAALLRQDRLASGPCCAAWSRPAPASSSSATAATARSTRSSTGRRPPSTRSPSAARARTTSGSRTSCRLTLDEIEAIGSRGGGMTGVPTGFADLDELTNGLHPGQMIVVAARPALGKCTLGLDFARSAAIKHGMTTCIFSLEMGRTEITMRLLSAEARVPLHHMRSGKMTDEDWARLARRMGEVAEAPLFIDDSPNVTMMEIRAKARRLKQRARPQARSSSTTCS